MLPLAAREIGCSRQLQIEAEFIHLVFTPAAMSEACTQATKNCSASKPGNHPDHTSTRATKTSYLLTTVTTSG